jgi:hypothetical protein
MLGISLVYKRRENEGGGMLPKSDERPAVPGGEAVWGVIHPLRRLMFEGVIRKLVGGGV